jgi:hypothetical protein
MNTDRADFANALPSLRMRRDHKATTLNQDRARTGNSFPYFSPATIVWAYQLSHGYPSMLQATGGKSTRLFWCAVHLISRPRFLHFTLNHHTIPQRSRVPRIRVPMLRVGANSKPAFRR